MNRFSIYIYIQVCTIKWVNFFLLSFGEEGSNSASPSGAQSWAPIPPSHPLYFFCINIVRTTNNTSKWKYLHILQIFRPDFVFVWVPFHCRQFWSDSVLWLMAPEILVNSVTIVLRHRNGKNTFEDVETHFSHKPFHSIVDQRFHFVICKDMKSM